MEATRDRVLVGLLAGGRLGQVYPSYHPPPQSEDEPRTVPASEVMHSRPAESGEAESL